jgi:pimeloyl-ACP methyl ester carboxylesterase
VAKCILTRPIENATLRFTEHELEFVEYGNKDGKLVVYFHGAPGGLKECAVFDSYAKDHCLKVICFDRFSIDNSLDRESYYQQIAREIRVEAGVDPVDIIGFSIGSHVALEVSAILGHQVRQIHLVSAAAPISSGDFLGQMAGGLVFRLAMQKPLVFSLLTQYQRFMALIAPTILVRMLFSSSTGKDKELARLPDFKRYITPVLKRCFQDRTNGYIRDIEFYVTWVGELSGYTNSVHLWHGTRDNWSPFSMASYLCNAIPGATHVEAMEGLSHYSCLFDAAPKICAKLENP